MSPLQLYFLGEKNAGWLLVGLSIASLGFGLWVWRSGGSFRAMAFPFALIGLAQLGIGVGLVVKTPGQVAKLEEGLVREPQPARAAETARMSTVMRNFTVIEIIEAVLLAAAVAAVFVLRSRPWAVGAGMGLAVQAAVMLAFDVFAEQRGAIYHAWLQGGG